MFRLVLSTVTRSNNTCADDIRWTSVLDLLNKFLRISLLSNACASRF